MNRTHVSWLVDRAKLLATALIIASVLLPLIAGFTLFVERLPHPVDLVVALGFMMASMFFANRTAMRRGLSMWGKRLSPDAPREPATEYKLQDLTWEELEGMAARKPNDTA